ncbi:DUF2934 domain-containing protein [Acidihalobacter ferrooxydans]|uniref:DUF2934 domain-containing protein n=1 Tax=Acidihalobacter ferrooxydans TaxID=1765967 RepID=A0A1P8UEU0_9GAMM|nr:DUF2934 domain-containing protein [Acidihalobacter ferrooxydans]APZ42326.1 hypothetical protein BW247_03835 [Acidihalobacter ferrooxydans]
MSDIPEVSKPKTAKTTTKKATATKTAKPAAKKSAATATAKPAAKTATAKAAKKPAPKATTKPSTGTKKAPTAKKAPVISAEQRYKMIEEAAYYIAEQNGFDNSRNAVYWLEAEAQIDKMLSGKTE